MSYFGAIRTFGMPLLLRSYGQSSVWTKSLPQVPVWKHQCILHPVNLTLTRNFASKSKQKKAEKAKKSKAGKAAVTEAVEEADSVEVSEEVVEQEAVEQEAVEQEPVEAEEVAEIETPPPQKSDKSTKKKTAQPELTTKTEAKEVATPKTDKSAKKKTATPAVEEEEEEEEETTSRSPWKKKEKKKGKSSVSHGALEDTIKQIEQSFGKGALMKLGTPQASSKVDVVQTGSLGLDVALGVGGLPLGRITEIFGPESSGKTTLALHIIAEAQKLGKRCTFIDAEHALNPTWAQKLGVDLNELLISQPDSGEQALEIADTLIRSGNMNVIVIDSVAALVPKAELEGEMGDSHIGLQARLMSQALRKISPSITKSNCMIIFINQIRMKIGVMFGNPETTTGGNALKFYSSVRLEIRRIGAVKKGEEVVGNQVRVKVAKNKLAPPFKEALFDIDFASGISRMGEVIDMGVKAKVIEKSGPWYSHNGVQIGQGREKTKQHLEQHPELASEIENAVRDKLLVSTSPIDDFLAESAANSEKNSKKKGSNIVSEDDEVVEHDEHSEEFTEDKS